MKFLCADKSLARCDLLKALLESNGIECVIKNEHMPFSGSGVGVFSPEPVFPELWVADEDQYEEALTIMGDSGDQAADSGTEDNHNACQP
ncbi:MAG: DUF2007 domain-containing protein [bacterium]